MTSCPTSPGNFTSHFFTSSASAAAHQNLITSGKPVRLLTPPSFQPGLYQATSQTTTERQERQDINTTCKLAHAHARAQTLSHTLGSGWRWAPASICSLLSLWQLITSRWKPHRCLSSHRRLSPPPPAAYPLFLPTLQSPSHTHLVSLHSPLTSTTRVTSSLLNVSSISPLLPCSFIFLSRLFWRRFSPTFNPSVVFCFKRPTPSPSISHSIHRENFHICVQCGFSFFFSPP